MAYVRASWLTVAACGFVCWYGVASAQTFYKWSDDKGTVHFSDVPPVDAKNVEERNLPAPPAQANPEEETEKLADKTPGASEGPARVVLVSRHAPRTGPTAVHVSGEVKNVGGADATGVSVTVTAVDITAGTPCLHEEVGVTPSTLRPGETGNFDTEIDNPCLAGGTPVDIATSSE
jgi:Domain of unknown function (DUF4124)